MAEKVVKNVVQDENRKPNGAQDEPHVSASSRRKVEVRNTRLAPLRSV